jgi:hypothetical protein
MAKHKGKVGYSDLEGGYFTLEGDDGTSYKLEGGDAGLRKKGQKVEVEGTVEEGGFGIGFGAPILTVKSYRALG